MSSALRIALETEKSGTGAPVAILRISGDLDSKTFQDLETKAGEVIDAGTTNLLLDMSCVNYIGSAGLRALHGISNKLKTGSGQLKLLKPSDAVNRIMHTLGFDKFFSIYGDLDEALKTF